jgi:hypothetical protein
VPLVAEYVNGDPRRAPKAGPGYFFIAA